MKIFNKIFVSIMAIALLFTTSCLDDEMVNIEVEDFAGSPYIADFNEMPTSAGYIKRSFPGTTDPSLAFLATFRVNLSSPWQLDEDLTLTIELDDGAVNDYIAENPGFVLFPSEKHDFNGITVTIPAGEREAEFSANFRTAGLSADDVFLVAFSIIETSNPDVKISGNFGTQLVKVGVANIYEGEYTVGLDWIYGGNGNNYGDDYTDWFIGTVSSVESVMDYFYTGWGYPITITVLDPDSPQTIDGHDNAFFVILDAEGKTGDDDLQLDDHEGGVWNYCYQQENGKWVFKLAHALTTGSGTHVGSGIFYQN
jgi:hypothetical protein